MTNAILSPGEKVHMIHRRHTDNEPHRHFVGVVNSYADGMVRVTGHVYTVDAMTLLFFRRPEIRTRIVAAVSGEVLINVLPASVQLDKVVYKIESNGMRVTDGSDWHLDISDVSWK
jgi:hypothetical protein